MVSRNGPFFLKAGLHYGDNRSKLVRFKKQQIFFCVFNIFSITTFFSRKFITLNLRP